MFKNFITVIFFLLSHFPSFVDLQHFKKLNGKCETHGPKHIIPCTRIHSGCRTFYGNVTCANGNSLLPEAKVVLWEEDYVSTDDYVTESEIENGNFELNGCVSDGKGLGSYVQLYLLFNNVCEKNETKRSGFLKEFTKVQYIIFDDEYNVKVIYD